MFSNQYRFDYDPADEVDTGFIVDALTNYIKRVFGVDESETYDYQTVNKVFPIDFKIFMKKIACYPQLITKEIYDKADSVYLVKLKDQEVKPGKPDRLLKLSVKDKLYLSMVAIESKKLASLLYLSKAVSDHLKN